GSEDIDLESTPVDEQDDVVDAALINESTVMFTEPEVEKQDPTAEIANDQIVNKDLASVEEELTQDKPVESTPAAE
ncbi:hypothetical protein Droror1_Dr00000075, partial [Drosera rotundifolia]